LGPAPRRADWRGWKRRKPIRVVWNVDEVDHRTCRVHCMPHLVSRVSSDALRRPRTSGRSTCRNTSILQSTSPAANPPWCAESGLIRVKTPYPFGRAPYTGECDEDAQVDVARRRPPSVGASRSHRSLGGSLRATSVELVDEGVECGRPGGNVAGR